MSFTEDMDTAVQPPTIIFRIDIDDVPYTPYNFNWRTDRMFSVDIDTSPLGPTDVDLKSLSTHPLFRTALGELVFPFDKQGYELDISATADYADPNLSIVITFQSAMDQGVQPFPFEFTIYANDVTKTPDSLNWTSATTMLINYAEAGLGVGPFDIQLPAATDRLRCLAGSVIPAFRLDDLPAP